ncbi:hypothetical protein MT325_m716L [Paramecium bursaria chlorella virus MT325]|uniref:Uncharacterized protein m716L n=1 Tax=Paramecium bursaria Chlorella virus MT325 TaxID=346932 RepID=A7IV96_PBCVM|nr:hypothetical protein MT325_m716L [Paramecium bursaria chlorella virus MT325]
MFELDIAYISGVFSYGKSHPCTRPGAAWRRISDISFFPLAIVSCSKLKPYVSGGYCRTNLENNLMSSLLMVSTINFILYISNKIKLIIYRRLFIS